jgi:hypothetical protein
MVFNGKKIDRKEKGKGRRAVEIHTIFFLSRTYIQFYMQRK